MTANDHLGHDVDGSGDFGRPAGSSFTADGLSDLLVGTNGGGRAFLFMGAPTGYPATPTVTFTGAFSGFGSAIVTPATSTATDCRHRHHVDRTTPRARSTSSAERIPPRRGGRTTSWPSTLMDTQANYVISADPGLTGMSFRNLARLGNFDGVGADDLLIAFRLRPARAAMAGSSSSRAARPSHR